MTKFEEKTFLLINKDVLKMQKLQKYHTLIETHNKTMNLTGFSGDKLWEEGIYQSILVLSNFLKFNDQLTDIGAGAGFPSIPIAIFLELDLTIIEPMQKRVKFLKLVSNELNLNINFISERVEDIIEEEKYLNITARAVTDLKKLIEITSKIGKINAKYLFFKGPLVFEEQQQAKKIIKELKISPSISKYIIDTKEIFLFQYTKTQKTPNEYPRKWIEIIKD